MGAGSKIIEMFPIDKDEIVCTVSDIYSVFEEHDFDVQEYPYIIDLLNKTSKTQTFEKDKKAVLDDLKICANCLYDLPKNYEKIIEEFLNINHPYFVVRKSLAHMIAGSTFINNISDKSLIHPEFNKFQKRGNYLDECLEAKIVIAQLDLFEDRTNLPSNIYLDSLNQILNNELYLFAGSDSREFYLRKVERLKEINIITFFDKELDSEGYKEFKNSENLHRGTQFFSEYSNEKEWKFKKGQENNRLNLKPLFFSHEKDVEKYSDLLEDDDLVEFYEDKIKVYMNFAVLEKKLGMESYKVSCEKVLEGITEGIRFNPNKLSFYELFLSYQEKGFPIQYDVLSELVDTYKYEFLNQGYFIIDNNDVDNLNRICQGMEKLY